MKKGLFAALLLAIFAFPALSFSAVGIGIDIPIGGPPVYATPGTAEVFQGTVVQSYPGSLVVQCPDGRQIPFAITPQTQVYGGLAVGSTVTVSAFPADGYLYAQSVNTVYPNYAAPAPYPVYPEPVYTDPYDYGYTPGFFGLRFGFGGHDRGFHGNGGFSRFHSGGDRGGWHGGEHSGGSWHGGGDRGGWHGAGGHRR